MSARRVSRKKRGPTALVTGTGGFAGSWLAEELLGLDYKVYGTILPGESTDNVAHIKSDLELTRLDITKGTSVRKLVEKVKPDYLLHLAAFASVGKSFETERAVFDVNFGGTFNLLEAAHDCSALRAFLFVGSPDCYGLFKPQNKTLTEDQPLAPVSPYGISKATADHLCRYYFRQYGLPIIVARAFNHTGPRQGPNFVVPAFARQIAQIEAGSRKPVLKVGNLAARRDLSDVRDIVRGYRLLIERGRAGQVYHLSSGRAVAIEQVLQQLLRLTPVEVKVETDPARMRPLDLPVLRGSNRKAASEVGFGLRYKLKTTLLETLDYWRARIK